MSAADAQRQLSALGIPARRAARNLRRFADDAGGDPYGVRTIEGAKAAYVRDEIDLAEFERRVGFLVAGHAVPTDGDRALARAVLAAKTTQPTVS